MPEEYEADSEREMDSYPDSKAMIGIPNSFPFGLKNSATLFSRIQ